MEDLESAYQQALQSAEKITLPPKTTSFQTWSQKLAHYANSESLFAEIPYWKSLEQIKLQPLPTDRQGSSRYSIGESKMAVATLPKDATQSLRTEVHQAYQTKLEELLLSASVRTISQWAGIQKVGMMLEGHGREELFQEWISRELWDGLLPCIQLYFQWNRITLLHHSIRKESNESGAAQGNWLWHLKILDC